MKNNLCLCCSTNLTINSKKLFCKSCESFIHERLQMTSVTISRRLGMKIYTHARHTCSFCHHKSVVSYNDYEYKKKYYICKSHLSRWLRIGCQIGNLSNFLHVEEQ